MLNLSYNHLEILPLSFGQGLQVLVTESARAHSYILSEEVQKTCQFWRLTLWLLTFWLLKVYHRAFIKL